MPASKSEISLERLLVVFVDFQSALLKNIPNGSTLLRRACFALEAAKTLGIPCIFTEQVPAKLGHTAPELRNIAPDTTTIEKTSFSAYGADAFREILSENETELLIVAGVETHICVYQTAVDARTTQLEVTLLSDCIGAARGEDHESALAQLVRHGCHALPIETVIYSILGSAEHTQFRAMNDLVKRYRNLGS